MTAAQAAAETGPSKTTAPRAIAAFASCTATTALDWSSA